MYLCTDSMPSGTLFICLFVYLFIVLEQPQVNAHLRLQSIDTNIHNSSHSYLQSTQNKYLQQKRNKNLYILTGVNSDSFNGYVDTGKDKTVLNV